MSKDLLSDLRSYFSTREVLQMLKIEREDLYSIMRPVRTKEGIKPPLFQPESTQYKNLVHGWIFSQKDIVKLSAYFRVYKEFKEAEKKLIEAKKELSQRIIGGEA